MRLSARRVLTIPFPSLFSIEVLVNFQNDGRIHDEQIDS
jgi:hypothetical protein